MRIRFHPEAEAELHEAAEWYALQRKGLDAEFFLCIDEALERVLRTPGMFPKAHKQAQKAIVRRFPFLIFFETGIDEIKVLAVFHSKRNPGKWKSRV